MFCGGIIIKIKTKNMYFCKIKLHIDRLGLIKSLIESIEFILNKNLFNEHKFVSIKTYWSK